MKISLTRTEIIMLNNVLTELGSRKANIRFSYAVAKNKRALKDEIEMAQDLSKPVDGLAEYDRERLELCRKYAKKDEHDEPVTNNNMFVIDPSKEKLFYSKIEKLGEQYKDTLAEADARKKQIEDFLNESVEVELYPIKFSYLPEDMEASILERLMPLVEEED